jgi:uroporphyrinogen decarboxylase
LEEIVTGKELLFAALHREVTERPAWVPYVGVHGGFLIGKTATEYLQSSDLIVEGLLKAKELYRPDGLPILFDLQIEAEALGCGLQWADEVPPAVATHPLAGWQKNICDLPEFNAQSGRMPIAIDALKKMKVACGDEIALYGLICGPFTLALHLLGSDIFTEMFENPEAVHEVIDYAADIAIKAAEIYLDNGADVIAVVDPMVSQISPRHFKAFAAPYCNKVFAAIRALGGYSSLFVCGDVTRNLDNMCQCTADSISVDEQINMAQLAEISEKHKIAFGGNMKLTTVLLLGDENSAKLEAISIIEASGNKGFILSPGCDLPYAVPPKNLEAVALMVHDVYQREVAKATITEGSMNADLPKATLPDYAKLDKVVVDIITLDSEACAPCQYMVEAVVAAVAECRVPIEWKEHKIKNVEGIATMLALGVANLPTICIDGKVEFISIIPEKTKIVEVIQAAAKAKRLA